MIYPNERSERTGQTPNASLSQGSMTEEQYRGNGKFSLARLQTISSPIPEPLPLDGQKQRLSSFGAAFPDVKITVDDIFAKGDGAAFRSGIRGTHQGVFQGIQPTGRSVTVPLLDASNV
jgi:hypothetical protein